MDAKKREIRTIDCQLSIREAAEGQEGESRTITGRAIVFNAESEVLDDWGERFREVILPEAVTMEFLNTQDVKMNMLHERELTIARCNKGVGSLRMAVDEQGVTFEFEAPKCDIGDRCLEMVRRGDYSGCSFEFYPKDYEVERTKGADGKEEVIIRHRSFEFLSSLTIGMDPAYRQTSVNVRELKGGVIEGTEETEEQKREREEREAQALREQEEREREQRAIAAHSRRKREIEMFDIENNY
jgi:HK97 family phage prohead protease